MARGLSDTPDAKWIIEAVIKAKHTRKISKSIIIHAAEDAGI